MRCPFAVRNVHRRDSRIVVAVAVVGTVVVGEDVGCDDGDEDEDESEDDFQCDSSAVVVVAVVVEADEDRIERTVDFDAVVTVASDVDGCENEVLEIGWDLHRHKAFPRSFGAAPFRNKTTSRC